MKKKILIDIDVVAVAEHYVNDKDHSISESFIDGVKSGEFETYTTHSLLALVENWKDKTIREKVLGIYHAYCYVIPAIEIEAKSREKKNCLMRFNRFTNAVQISKQFLVGSSFDCMRKYLSFVFLHTNTNDNCHSKYLNAITASGASQKNDVNKRKPPEVRKLPVERKHGETFPEFQQPGITDSRAGRRGMKMVKEK